MRQKELRIALVCYGGVSLAVYMHGVTKELWHLARASRDFLDHHRKARTSGTPGVYTDLLREIEKTQGIKLRVLCDIVAGASAGGLNGLFLAQAIHSGRSLEPLTRLWLERADVDVLLAPEARRWRFSKLWAMPIVWWMLRRPGNAVSHSVAPETRAEVRSKLSRLIRSRWFAPPFSGIGFARLLAEALDAMEQSQPEPPLLPPGHPLDAFVTATDFAGHLTRLQLNSPPDVEESEHRLSIGFRQAVPAEPGQPFAPLAELVFAGRATASFPGAFPALRAGEIDRLIAGRNEIWSSRDAFLQRIMPVHAQGGDLEIVSLIDGSVLNNAPFAPAMGALRDRPAQREVDRRFVYIDPRPDRYGGMRRDDPAPPGFFSVIFGSLSSIPREQPVRDNLEAIERHSRELRRLRTMVDAIRPEVEQAVEGLFGRTLFFDRPTAARLTAWRAKAQQAAAERAGFAFNSYAHVKFAGIVDDLAELIRDAAPGLGLNSADPIARHLTRHLEATGLNDFSAPRGSGASDAAIAFFRTHDLGFRVRRLRLLARRLTEDWDIGGAESVELDAARDAVYRALALYFAREPSAALGKDFGAVAQRVFDDPAAALAMIDRHRQLVATDHVVDALLVEAMKALPRPLRRHMLLTYLGFPFYDTATLALLRGEGLTEFDPAKVDRISPDDAQSIRTGGAAQTLRGTEFYNFGAFFSRAYRENDYLWGRLHGAERMVDLIASALPPAHAMGAAELAAYKRKAFVAILDEEQSRLTADPNLIARIRREIEERG